MATSKLEKNIDRIIAYLDSCKPVPFSSGRVMVTKDEMYDMLETMKISLPEEISQYKKIVDNRQRILDDAEQKGDGSHFQGDAHTLHIEFPAFPVDKALIKITNQFFHPGSFLPF